MMESRNVLKVFLCLMLAFVASSAKSQYVARDNFGAKFEINDKIIHGIGQHADDNNAQGNPMIYEGYISNVVGAREPVIYSCYTEVRDYGASKLQGRINEMNAQENANSNLQWVPLVGIAIKPWVQAVKNGNNTSDYEGWWEDIMTKMINSGRKWYVRPGYEANGPWNGYNKSAYKTVFRYMHDRLECRNVQAALVFNIATNGASTSFMDWYPGDSYVDWLGINHFENSSTSHSITSNLVNEASSRNKPIMICESTPKDDQVNNGQSDWDKWFKPYFNWMKNTSEVKAFVYINWDWTQTSQWPTWGDCRIETNNTVKNNWNNELSNSIFRHAKWTPGSISYNCGSGSTAVYRIESKGRDWWLQASGSNTSAYTASQSSTGDFTKWEVEDIDGTWFYLNSVGKSGYRLEDNNGTPKMVTAQNHSGNRVQWKKVDAGNPYFRLQNRNSGDWLQASGSNTGTYMTGTGSTGDWTRWKLVGTVKSLAVLTPEFTEDEAVSVYPNPSDGLLTVKAEAGQLVTVTTSIGKPILRKSLKKGEELIDLSGYNKGIYFIRVNGTVKRVFVK